MNNSKLRVQVTREWVDMAVLFNEKTIDQVVNSLLEYKKRRSGC